jgi:hypothetical protein
MRQGETHVSNSIVITVKVLSNFFCLICFMAENKSNTQYFERALSKSLTKFGHTTLKEQQKSCIRKLVVDSQGPLMSLPFYELASAKVLFIRSYWRCFLSYIAFVMVYDKEFRYCCCYPVRNCISASRKLRP